MVPGGVKNSMVPAWTLHRGLVPRRQHHLHTSVSLKALSVRLPFAHVGQGMGETDTGGNQSNGRVSETETGGTNREGEGKDTDGRGVAARPRAVNGDAGAVCAWPRACAWPMKQKMASRGEIAKDAMSTAAAAAAAGAAANWSDDEDDMYTLNDVDTDLPPDVELLALFSDSPMVWSPREEVRYGEMGEVKGGGMEGLAQWMRRWWSRMWRYQGLGL